jgi:hypothetical protein
MLLTSDVGGHMAPLLTLERRINGTGSSTSPTSDWTRSTTRSPTNRSHADSREYASRLRLTCQSTYNDALRPARTNLDRHPNDILAAYMASGT